MERTKDWIDGILNSIWGMIDNLSTLITKLGETDFSENFTAIGIFLGLIVIHTIVSMWWEYAKEKGIVK